MQVITFFNEKGGVGKTTLTTHCAWVLANRGANVLVLDADGQANATQAFGLERDSHMYDWFMRVGKTPTRKLVVYPDPADARPVRGNVFVVPGNREVWAAPTVMGTRELAKALGSRLQDVSRLDYVLIDTQPSKTSMHDALSYVTNWYVIPSWLDEYSLAGVAATYKKIQEFREPFLARGIRDRCNVLGIVPNFSFRYQLDDRTAYEVLVEEYGNLVLAPIPKRVNILGQPPGPNDYHLVPEFMALIEQIEEAHHVSV